MSLLACLVLLGFGLVLDRVGLLLVLPPLTLSLGPIEKEVF